MPLFVCSKCGCVENTAISNYWQHLVEKRPKLCSECDPEIGQWHGLFPKSKYDPERDGKPGPGGELLEKK